MRLRLLSVLMVSLATLAAPSALAAGSSKAASPKAATPAKEPPVAVADAWVREAPPGARAMAGYMALTNRGTRPLTLVGVSSPLFDSVEMHTIIEEDGRLHMKQVLSLAIAPGKTLEFKPGDQHLMLMHPKQAIKAGDKVPLTLDFGKDGRLTLTPDVKRPAPRNP